MVRLDTFVSDRYPLSDSMCNLRLRLVESLSVDNSRSGAGDVATGCGMGALVGVIAHGDTGTASVSPVIPITVDGLRTFSRLE